MAVASAVLVAMAEATAAAMRAVAATEGVEVTRSRNVSFGSTASCAPALADGLRLHLPQQQTSASESPRFRQVPILLKKSQFAGRRIFRENTKREAIADSYSLPRIAEVASESA